MAYSVVVVGTNGNDPTGGNFVTPEGTHLDVDAFADHMQNRPSAWLFYKVEHAFGTIDRWR